MDSADTVDPIHYDGIYDHASVGQKQEVEHEYGNKEGNKEDKN